MKYKFHEEPPILEVEMGCIGDEVPEPSKSYKREIAWIASNLKLDVTKFKVNDYTFAGDPFVMYSGNYMGYLDNRFYLAFDGVADYEFNDWWEFDN